MSGESESLRILIGVLCSIPATRVRMRRYSCLASLRAGSLEHALVGVRLYISPTVYMPPMAIKLENHLEKGYYRQL